MAANASTAYLNPAGMTRLRGRHMVVGGQYLNLSMEFLTSVGRSGENAGSANVVPGGLFRREPDGSPPVWDESEPALRDRPPYGDDWAGRYFIRDIQLIALDFRPSLALRLTRRLSIGADPRSSGSRYRRRWRFPIWTRATHRMEGWTSHSTIGASGFRRGCSSSPAR